MQRIHPLTSLGAKLFYLTAALVLATVSVNSWQNARMFQRDLERFSEDTTLTQALAAAQTTSTILENWESQVSLVMHGVQGSTEANRAQLIDRFLGASGEMAAFHLVKVTGGAAQSLTFALSPHQDDARFNDHTPAQMAKLLKSATTALIPVKKDAPSQRMVVNLSTQTKLPLLAMALPFNYGNGERIWAVLVVWQDRLSGVLPASALVTTLLVDAAGDILSSGRRLDGAAWLTNTITQLLGLQASTLAASSFARFPDDGAGDWFGAYGKVPKQNLYVLVRRDAKALHAATVNLIKRTVLWGWIFVLFAIMASFLGASSLTKHLRILTAATRRIAAGDFDTTVKSTSRDEIGVLSHAVTDMGTQIQSLLTAQIAKVRLEAELATAKIVQQSFFPRQLGEAKAFRLAADYHPASECGGDWWGFFPSGDGREFLCIADATGHGAPAALVTAMAYTTAAILGRAVAANTAGDLTPAALLAELNVILWSALKGQVGMTFFAAVVDRRTQQMHFANAGHNFPILLPADPTRRAETIRQGGTPLGFDPEAVFTNDSVQVAVGDKLVLYTDGLLECQSPDGQMWGKRPLMKVLDGKRTSDPETLLAAVMQAAFAHFGDKPIDDDVTVVIAEILAA